MAPYTVLKDYTINLDFSIFISIIVLTMKEKILQNKLNSSLMALILLAIIIIAFSVLRNDATEQAPEIRGQFAKLTPITDFQNGTAIINATGEVESLQEVELKSQISERVSWVAVNIGDWVNKWELLISLNNAELSSILLQAEANLDAEIARLNEIQIGARQGELTISESGLERAQISFEESKQGLIDTIRDAYIASDDSIRNKIDQFFINPRGFLPTLMLIADIQEKSDLEYERMGIENMMTEWENSIQNIETNENMGQHMITARENLQRIKTFLNDIAFVINQGKIPADVSPTAFAGWKADVSLARTSISGAITALSAMEEKFRQSETALNIASEELNLVEEGATNEQVAIQEARVKSAEASVKNAQAQVAKTQIRSPISGNVASVDVSIGELVAPGQLIASIVNTKQLQVTTFLNSDDLNFIEIGARAIIDSDIEGNVVRIAPSINPQTKKVEVIIAITDGQEKQLFVGDFVDVKIFTNGNADSDIFIVPLEAVKVDSRGSFLYGMNNENIVEEISVQTGRVLGESIEITDGILPENKILDTIRGINPGDKIEPQE
ncbi:efflux RND transporter periplasmic adaptor subunit [Patescibacteria group bacterium]